MCCRMSNRQASMLYLRTRAVGRSDLASSGALKVEPAIANELPQYRVEQPQCQRTVGPETKYADGLVLQNHQMALMVTSEI